MNTHSLTCALARIQNNQIYGAANWTRSTA